MLGKLLKYEFKATARILLPIYLLLILVALIAGFTISPSKSIFSSVIVLVFFGLALASVVITLVITVQRFQNNLLGDEGYLMFTLPVSVSSLILSKLIVAVCWFIIGTIAGIISACALSLTAVNSIDFIAFFQDFRMAMAAVEAEQWLMMLQTIIACIMSYALFVLVIYTSLSIGQLPVAGKHRKGASLLAFFLIYIIYAFIGAVFGDFMTSLTNLSFATNLGIAMAFDLLLIVIMFLFIRFILSKHLNLE